MLKPPCCWCGNLDSRRVLQYPINYDKLITIRWPLYLHTLFICFLKKGNWKREMSRKHGIIRGTLVLAMICGLDVKRLFWRALQLAMEPLSAFWPMSQRMYLHKLLLVAYHQSLLEIALMIKLFLTY